jgi:hypothetical protein
MPRAWSSSATTIDATTFDMDGTGAGTAWTIGNSLTINAAAIDGGNNTFNGSIASAGNFLGKLTVNLDDPNDHWTMAGTMDLGVLSFMATHVLGSEMRVTGELAIDGQVRISADTRLMNGSVLAFDDASARLRLSGTSLVGTGADIVGGGRLEVGADGDMTLSTGADLADAGLLNLGVLRVGAFTGSASVSAFENADSGTLAIEIAGYTPGSEHDLLSVTTGDALLDGALDVTVTGTGGDLFEPQPGDAFVILEAPGTVTGSFANSPVSFVPGRVYLWSVHYNADSVVLMLDEVVPCPADLNGDGTTGGADIGLLLAAWGTCDDCIADINLDGAVDGIDLGLLLSSGDPCLF